jgi:MerR family mercuric resistance operon transcriptional regulator
MARLPSYTRGGLAKSTGCHPETIRYYEREGLLPVPARTSGGHRIYDDGTVRQLAFVLRCRDLGFELADVRDLLRLMERGSLTCGEVRALATRHLEKVRAKLERLGRMEQTLATAVARCRGGRVPDCPIVDALANETQGASRATP